MYTVVEPRSIFIIISAYHVLIHLSVLFFSQTHPKYPYVPRNLCIISIYIDFSPSGLLRIYFIEQLFTNISTIWYILQIKYFKKTVLMLNYLLDNT